MSVPLWSWAGLWRMFPDLYRNLRSVSMHEECWNPLRALFLYNASNHQYIAISRWQKHHKIAKWRWQFCLKLSSPLCNFLPKVRQDPWVFRVRQNLWRPIPPTRTRLGLSKDQSLEEFLRRYNRPLPWHHPIWNTLLSRLSLRICKRFVIFATWMTQRQV